MQNGLDHELPRDHDLPPVQQPRNIHEDVATFIPETACDEDTKDASIRNLEEKTNGIQDDGPPTKRRRLADFSSLQRSSPRAVSPPWKKIAAEGPTSFIESGKRRSARTNLIPLELRPQSGKRQTRATDRQAAANVKGKHSGSKPFHSSPPVPRSTPRQTYGKKGRGGSRLSLPSGRSAAKAKNSPATPLSTSSKRTSLRQPYHRRLSPSPSPETPKRKLGRPRRDTTTSATTPRRSGRKFKRELSEQDETVESAGSGEAEDEDGSLIETDDDFVFDPNITPQRLNLKVRLPEVKPRHPLNIPVRKKHASFKEWIESGAAEDGPSLRLSDAQVKIEARMRRRLMLAQETGGKLSNVSDQDVPEFADEPVAHYHYKYLNGHAVNMRSLMDKEKRRHRFWAQKICAALHEYWAMARPKTKEELEEEEARQWRAYYQAVMRQCCVDLGDKYGMLRAELEKHRLKLWEQEEEVRQHAAMMNVAEEKRKRAELRFRRGSDAAGDDVSDEDSRAGSGTDDEIDSASVSDESNMSIDSGEQDRDSDGEADGDENLSPEELRRKYSASVAKNIDALPKGDLNDDTSMIAAEVHGSRLSSIAYADEKDVKVSVDMDDEIARPMSRAGREDSHMELDDAQLDETDESTDMDNDMGDSDEGSNKEDTEGSSAESDDEPTASYLALFSSDELEKASIQAITADGPERIATSDAVVQPPSINGKIEQDEDQDGKQADVKHETSPCHIPAEKQTPTSEQDDEPSLLDVTQVQTPPASNSEAPSLNNANDRENSNSAVHETSREQSPLRDTQDQMPKDEENADGTGTSLPATPVSSARIKTPVPSLLRGTLREYQHQGLDWLVGLYENGENGILADEMGLGKTVQTISLLAHLAEKFGQWGPHLIVVPTSVILNWEMEFKKFLPGFKVLTYYGTQDERKQKRKGWLDDNKWNAVITSYQLVLKDEVSFKKRGWHYLVLDEAHNIKNFKSQRWQTLLTFKTAARLLLTGTPLQNNLAELWSLMFFLMPSEENDTGVQGFTDLDKFTAWFKKPVDQIMEQGRGTMDKEAQELVRTLHQILRPYLLRRLKADVEKQMPGKHEHVVYCKLSKRQRYLYDGFMSRTDTRLQLASGNYLSIINCLMQLRKVCNHPDLFEERPIVTSFALKKPTIADYEIKEFLIRRRLLRDDDEHQVSLDVIDLLPGSNGPVSALATLQQSRIEGIKRMREIAIRHSDRIQSDVKSSGATVSGALATLGADQRIEVREKLHHLAYLTSLRSQRRPLMSYSLIDKLRLDLQPMSLRPRPTRRTQLLRWFAGQSPAMEDMVLSLPRRFEALQTTIQKFSFVTPTATLRQDHISELYLTQRGKTLIKAVRPTFPQDNFHESRMRLSIAFPDKRLLQYDCGKLQRLDHLLRSLKSGGHRALIFTQMTKVLDVLERFLNIHGHRYLRLDGSTKVEQRQILTERFNNDARIPVFILSSRSGGLGINLTGADTVIFYDLDWNPAMDKQCQDRCHRIGQTRDVHIYRFVSEYTIEANILRKANQKRLLDDVIIQDGEFTTDFFNKADNPRDVFEDEAMHEQDADASAAMDRILGAGAAGGEQRGAAPSRLIAHADDEEDRKAAMIAEKEAQFTEDPREFEDPEDRQTEAQAAGAGVDQQALTDGVRAEAHERSSEDVLSDESPEVLRGLRQPESELEVDVFAGREAVGVDLYILRLLQWELRDVPVGPPPGFEKSKKSKMAAHRIRRR